MRTGENIRYMAPGEVLVSIPVFQHVGDGNVQVIGDVIMDQRADPRFMDPDAHLMKHGGEMYYNGFRHTDQVVIEESDKETPYIYKNNKGRRPVTIRRVEPMPINTVCPMCGASPLRTVHCLRAGGMAVCETHCEACQYHEGSRCTYQKKPP